MLLRLLLFLALLAGGHPVNPQSVIRTPGLHLLPILPIHLYQMDPAAPLPQGCGAYSTAMALSVYDRTWASPARAAELYREMVQVPFVGGTFEQQNAVAARRAGYRAQLRHGTVADLVALVDRGTPAILLVEPVLGIGQHDVVLVGYQADQAGKVVGVVVDNPGSQGGREEIAVASLTTWWTGVYTAILTP